MGGDGRRSTVSPVAAGSERPSLNVQKPGKMSLFLASDLPEKGEEDFRAGHVAATTGACVKQAAMPVTATHAAPWTHLRSPCNVATICRGIRVPSALETSRSVGLSTRLAVPRDEVVSQSLGWTGQCGAERGQRTTNPRAAVSAYYFVT